MSDVRAIVYHPDGAVSWDDGSGYVPADEVALRRAKAEAKSAERERLRNSSRNAASDPQSPGA